MSVNGKCRQAEGLNHYNGGGFVAHSWERFEFGKGLRHPALVFFMNNFRQSGDCFGLGGGKSAGADNGLDFFDGHAGHVAGVVTQCEERRGDFVDPNIGAAGR